MAVGAIVNFVALYVIAAPEIKSVQDLRGKPVGVTRFGATTDFAMQMYLKKYGLEPVRDEIIVQHEPGHGDVSFRWVLARAG